MSLDFHRLAGRPVVVGGGLAGLMTALHLAPLKVVLLSKSKLGTEASSVWAQGGLAAAMGADDSPALHLADTIAAGDGLCDEAAARSILVAAPATIETLARLGVRFDRGPDGMLRLGLEAAHSRRRIVHAGGDGSGGEVMRALVAAVRSSTGITVIEGAEAKRLAVVDGRIAGVLVAGPAGRALLPTGQVVLATGGIGGLFDDTTNPLGSRGQGLAMAARAGAVLADLEFVQFHPTALDGPDRPMWLISEALRGEGATIIDETGRRFLEKIVGAELAPRDIVARAVARHLAKGHRVFLDASRQPGATFERHFPTIAAACRKAGLDPANEPIPIRPAQHYHMGGVAVDAAGRSSVPGLWACGEVASTGLHGANRLASNSLIEAVVCAAWVAESVSGCVPVRSAVRIAPEFSPSGEASNVRRIVSCALGVVRDGESLRAAMRDLTPMAQDDDAAVALMIAASALKRRESRGAHFRTDFPNRAAVACRSQMTLDAALAEAETVGAAPVLESVA